MIKEILDKYESVSILCNGQGEFIKFINDATLEVEFSKTINYQRMMLPKKSIFKYMDKYIKNSESVYILINKRHWMQYDEYNIHIRSEKLYKKYNDCEKYYILDYSPFFRKEKIEKIKRKLN